MATPRPSAAIAAVLLHVASACFCADPSLCAPVHVAPRPEVFAFQTDSNDANWPHYNWDVLTTVVAFSGLSETMICHAHASSVKVSVLAPFPKDQLHNSTFLGEFIDFQITQARTFFLDGINFDFEDPLDTAADAAALTQVVQSTSTALKAALGSDFQVSVDVAWSPNCIDGRCYDYQGIADAADLLFVMAYDMRSQVLPPAPCTASANSPLPLVRQGMANWTGGTPGVNVDPSKLILGVPWYGYVYTCVGSPPPGVDANCPIASVPFRNVSCSDAAGYEVNLSGGEGSLLSLLLHNASRGYTWDGALEAPWFDVLWRDGSVRQIWFDDPTSTGLKFAAAKSAGWRGVGMWNLDALDYTGGDPYIANVTAAMWDALGRWYA